MPKKKRQRADARKAQKKASKPASQIEKQGGVNFFLNQEVDSHQDESSEEKKNGVDIF